jgi:hypothetical protein
MSHSPLRTEKDCLNCGSQVEERYCPKCGQENVEVRPSFHHLFTHFFADLFHYDSGFWKTIIALLFKPGKIVRDYLDGKRKSYVEPVKLYIFVSFVAFFLPHFLPNFADKYEETTDSEVVSDNEVDFEGIEVAGVKNVKTIEQLDSIQTSLPVDQKIAESEYQIMRNTLKLIDYTTAKSTDGSTIELNLTNFEDFKVYREEGVSFGKHYKNIKTLQKFDSIHQAMPENKKLNWAYAKFARKMVDLQEREIYKNEDLLHKFKEAFLGNLPKALFFYLPFFAFSLWLVHRKRKWLYYDHGIFTLYFFSALLIFITFINLMGTVISVPAIWCEGYVGTSGFLIGFFTIAIILYLIFYFFRAHHKVYMESAWKSRLKCILLLFFNSFLLFLVLLGYTIFTFMVI